MNKSDQQLVFHARRPRGAEMLAWWLFGVLPAAVMLAYSYSQTVFYYNHYGPVAAQYRPRGLWLFAGGWALLCLVLFALRSIRARSRLKISSRGVTLIHATRRPITIPWHDIAGIWYKPPWSTPLSPRPVVRLRTKKGWVSIGSRFPDLPTIAHELQARLYPFLKPKLQAQAKRGAALSFGKVALTPEGLFYRHLYPWRSISRISLANATLVLELKNSSIKIPIHRVENPEIMLRWLTDQNKQ